MSYLFFWGGREGGEEKEGEQVNCLGRERSTRERRRIGKLLKCSIIIMYASHIINAVKIGTIPGW